jgi:hypothetical protein
MPEQGIAVVKRGLCRDRKGQPALSEAVIVTADIIGEGSQQVDPIGLMLSAPENGLLIEDPIPGRRKPRRFRGPSDRRG